MNRPKVAAAMLGRSSRPAHMSTTIAHVIAYLSSCSTSIHCEYIWRKYRSYRTENTLGGISSAIKEDFIILLSC